MLRKETIMTRVFPSICGQRGLATTRQLLRAGWTPGSLHHLATTSGRRVMPRVYCPHRGVLGEEELLVAAWLWAGDGALLTGARALVRHGLVLPAQPRLFRFVVPDSRNNRAEGMAETLHAHHPPASRILGGLPVVHLERALLDAARGFEFVSDDIRAITVAALQQRLTSPARIRDALMATSRNGTAGIRRGLRDFLGGAWSLPEVVLSRLLARHRPTIEFLANPRLCTREGALIGVPDVYLPEYSVALQVHSRQHHSGVGPAGQDRWAETVEGDARYLAHGIAPLGVAPSTLRDRPTRFLRLLDAVVSVQSGRPPADVIIYRARGEAQAAAS